MALGFPPLRQFTPPGLTLDPSTGVISGTVNPLQQGPTALSSLTVTDSAHQSVTIGWILYSTAATPLQAAFSSHVLANPGQPYSAVVQATGGEAPYTYTVTPGSAPPGYSPGLPLGLTLNSSTGVISGVPQRRGFGR